MRSADPENLILKPNITLIGKAVAKLWPFLYIQDGCQPPSCYPLPLLFGAPVGGEAVRFEQRPLVMKNYDGPIRQ